MSKSKSKRKSKRKETEADHGRLGTPRRRPSSLLLFTSKYRLAVLLPDQQPERAQARRRSNAIAGALQR